MVGGEEGMGRETKEGIGETGEKKGKLEKVKREWEGRREKGQTKQERKGEGLRR